VLNEQETLIYIYIYIYIYVCMYILDVSMETKRGIWFSFEETTFFFFFNNSFYILKKYVGICY
jgi:hypothetical protein